MPTLTKSSNHLLKSITVVLFAFALLQSPALAQKKMGASKVPGPATIHQEADFKATPQQVYDALLSTKEFCAFSAPGGFSATSAQIDPAVGGTFSVFDGHIIGRNIELVPGKRIVQAWRVVDWPEGIYSIAKFELTANASGTHLIFDHTGFPVSLRDHLAQGWQEHYWDPLAKYFH